MANAKNAILPERLINIVGQEPLGTDAVIG
jgi:hypothetical protein